MLYEEATETISSEVTSMESQSSQTTMGPQPNQQTSFGQQNLDSLQGNASGQHAAGQNLKRPSDDVTSANETKRSNLQSKQASIDSSTQYSYSVPTGNRFQPLSSELEPNNQNWFSYINETSPSVSESVKIPPIYVANITNITNFSKEINTKVTNSFTLQFINNRVKIQPEKISDFRDITKYLINTGRQFHTYKDPANKKFSVVFKNLHTSITEEEIYTELKEKHPSLIKVTRLRKDNNPIPVIAAEFSGEENIETILEINQICNLIVKAERRRRPKGPIQCMRCLDFGHTKNNCNHKIACIYCSKNHYSATCPHKNEPFKCYHCQGNHRADLRTVECPYYKKISQNPNLNNPQNRTRTNESSTAPPQNTQTNFPGLRTTQNIPNFTHINNRNTAQNFNQRNNPQNLNSHAHTNENSFLNSLINTIATHIINIINSIIPSIISNIQSSISAYINNNYATNTN